MLIPSPFAFSLPQHQGFFLSISSSNQVAKVSISPSNGYLGLISFRIDWFVLLAVQGILKSLLQHHSSKASILRCSTSFLCGPILTSIHDYWKNHSFVYTDLSQEHDASAFEYTL